LIPKTGRSIAVIDVRTLILRAAAAIIAVGAILAAVLWPETSTCITRCNAFISGGAVIVVDSHIEARVLVVTVGLTLGAIILALSFSKKVDRG
jgi:hypothetical protein